MGYRIRSVRLRHLRADQPDRHRRRQPRDHDSRRREESRRRREPQCAEQSRRYTGVADVDRPRSCHSSHGFLSRRLHDEPSNWSIVEGRATKKWADPDTGKITRAGNAFAAMALSIQNGVSIPKTTPSDPPPDVGPINGAVDRLFVALQEVLSACGNMKSACDQTAKWSDLERDQIRALLTDAAIIIAVYEAWPGRFLEGLKEAAVNMVKDAAARDVDRLLTELDSYISGPPEGHTGGPYPPSGTVGVLGSPNPGSNDPTHRGGTYGNAR